MADNTAYRTRLLKTVKVSHACGEWTVFVYQPTLTEQEYLGIASLGQKATPYSTNSFKTYGLAIGWIKRLAKHYPDHSSIFSVIEWAGTWDIHFQ